MKTAIKTLLALLMSLGISGALLAQDDPLIESQNVTAMIAALNTDIADLEFQPGIGQCWTSGAGGPGLSPG